MRRLAEAAWAIVICVEDSEGVWWEVENLLGGPYFNKTLFLIHPNSAALDQNRMLMEKLISGLPRLSGYRAELLEPAAPKHRPVVLGFFAQDASLMIGRSSSCSRFAYLLMLRWFLRARSDLLRT